MDEQMNSEKTKALVEEYDRHRKKLRRAVLLTLAIVAGAALMVAAALFRTQYPLILTDKGMVHYNYSHILLRDVTNYDYFNNITGHEVKYYIVYRNAGLYYELETDFATYSSHASKENVQPGITNHSVIRETVDKYTFVARNGNTYCYESKTPKIKALFDASYAGGKIYWRFVCYILGAALIFIGGFGFGRAVRKEEKEKNSET